MPLRDQLEQVSNWLDGIHARGAFNGAVLIAKQGQIIFDKRFGFTDVDERMPLSARSSFSLASVSKHFTAAAILLLAYRGKLSLQDAVAQHVPELGEYDDVTIRHLLHHTSGAPDYMELASQYWDTTRVLTTKDVVDLFSKHRPGLYFDPGDEFEYSNTGYSFLEEVVTRASGKPYPQFMGEESFKPLQMMDSATFNLTSRECPLRSAGLRGQQAVHLFWQEEALRPHLSGWRLRRRRHLCQRRRSDALGCGPCAKVR